jgi:hypothetical protein
LRWDSKSRIVKFKGKDVVAFKLAGKKQPGSKSPWDEPFKEYKILG